MQFKRLALTLICTLLFLLVFSFTCNQIHTADIPKLTFFYSPDCHKCTKIKNDLMPDIEKEFKGQIEIEYRDVSNIDNYIFLLSLGEKYRKKIEVDWPVFFFKGKFLTGKQNPSDNLKQFIAKSIGRFYREERLPEIDLISRFKTFKPLAVIGAGLVDGINPCAFTVIVFFISFLALQGYRKKELIIIGLSFILSVFITYLLIGLGIFNFLYQLKGFWWVTRIINIAIGIFSIVLGTLSLYDFFKFKRTGMTEGLLLQLPQVIKNRIHFIIGLHYRKSNELKEGVRPHIFRLLVSAFVVGFLISILEAVCTGQVYLPTITFVLKTSSLKLQALRFLFLYNLMFIMPLLVIFFFALIGITSEQFAKFLKKNLLLTKILMSILFFSLGIFLIWNL